MLTSRPICARCATKALTRASIALRKPDLTAPYATQADSPTSPFSVYAGRPSAIQPSIRRKGVPGHRVSEELSQASAVALFKDIVQPQGKDDSNGESPSAQERDIAAKLRAMHQSERSLELQERLDLFKKDILPYFKSLEGPAPKHIYVFATSYIGNIAHDVVRRRALGFSVELSKIWTRISQTDLAARHRLSLNLCYILIKRHGKKGALRLNALDELIDFWKHLSQLRRPSQEGQPLQFTFPDEEDILNDLRKAPTAEGLEEGSPRAQISNGRALASLFLQFDPTQAALLFPGLLTTAVILWNARIVGNRIPKEAEPLLKALRTVLRARVITPAFVEGAFAAMPPANSVREQQDIDAIRAWVVKRWSQTSASMTNSDELHWGETNDSSTTRGNASLLVKFHDQMKFASKKRDVGALVALWDTLKTRLAGEPEMAQQLRDDPDFLDFWIFIWCSSRKNHKLQETLDMMKSIQLAPSVKSYTSMMHGWKVCKDTARIDALWKMLVQSGIELDSYIWAERISAYVESGKPQKGIEALGEMMRFWKKAVAEGRPDTATKPTIAVVNATIKVLLRLDKQAAHEVLAWASREGIDPDVITYNILIGEAFRSDSRETVPTLLRAMQQNNVSPDSATFTIILEEALGGMRDAPPSDQVGAIDQIFRDMKESGLQPKLETYGKMLHAVALVDGGGAEEAVEAVQKHMRDANLSVTPHMITILIERALLKDPTNTSRMESLLRANNIRTVRDGDQTLWERVMKAYASAGQVQSALKVYNDLRKLGRPVSSLPALQGLLSALVEDGETKAAREVVAATLKTRVGDGKDGSSGRESREGRERYWRHHFWFLAENKGLLDGLELPQELSKILKRV